MVKPDEFKIKDCPFGCGGKIELKTKHTRFESNGKIYEGDRWVYECTKCQEGFTTTESDTISMNNLKVRKL